MPSCDNIIFLFFSLLSWDHLLWINPDLIWREFSLISIFFDIETNRRERKIASKPWTSRTPIEPQGTRAQILLARPFDRIARTWMVLCRTSAASRPRTPFSRPAAEESRDDTKQRTWGDWLWGFLMAIRFRGRMSGGATARTTSWVPPRLISALKSFFDARTACAIR